MRDLTKRELMVLCLAARGASNYAIAHKLGLETQTVKNYLRGAYSKLFADPRNPGKGGRRTLTIFYALRTGQLSWKEIEEENDDG